MFPRDFLLLHLSSYIFRSEICHLTIWNRQSQEAAAPQSVTLVNSANVIQMFHKAALTSRHEIKMFVELHKWEMTTGDQRKAEEGDTFRGRRLCWRLLLLTSMDVPQLGIAQTGGLLW